MDEMCFKFIKMKSMLSNYYYLKKTYSGLKLGKKAIFELCSKLQSLTYTLIKPLKMYGNFDHYTRTRTVTVTVSQSLNHMNIGILSIWLPVANFYQHDILFNICFMFEFRKTFKLFNKKSLYILKSSQHKWEFRPFTV